MDRWRKFKFLQHEINKKFIDKLYLIFSNVIQISKKVKFIERAVYSYWQGIFQNDHRLKTKLCGMIVTDDSTPWSYPSRLISTRRRFPHGRNVFPYDLSSGTNWKNTKKNLVREENSTWWKQTLICPRISLCTPKTLASESYITESNTKLSYSADKYYYKTPELNWNFSTPYEFT